MVEIRTTDYWFSNTAIYIQLNAVGDPNYLHANCSSGSMVMCYVRGVPGLGFDNAHNYQRWNLIATPTVFHDDLPKYVYIAIPRDRARSSIAQIVFPSELVDMYGINASGDQIGSDNYYYINTQGLISASRVDGQQCSRSWIHPIDCGSLASDEAAASGGEGSWWEWNAASDTVKFLKKISAAEFLRLAADLASFGQLSVGERLLNAVAHDDGDSPTPDDSTDAIVTPAFAAKRALSRLRPDEASGLISFLKGLVSEELARLNKGAHFGAFASGMMAGTGGAVDGKGNAEFESLRVRSSFEVLELLVNRLAAVEGDQLFTEGDTIESVDDLGSRCYGLRLRRKYEGYFTAFTAGAVVKGVFNDLPSGGGSYFASWMRVNSVNAAANYIEVALYPDADTPEGANHAPCGMMRIARWGHQTDESRQHPIEISSSDRRISIFSGVTKPILDAIANYGMTIGKLPEWLAADLIAKGYAIDVDQDYIYGKGVIAEQFIQVPKDGKLPLVYEDAGEWTPGGDYACERDDPANNRRLTHYAWHHGCKYQCCKDATATEPAWGNTDWMMREGNPAFELTFVEAPAGSTILLAYPGASQTLTLKASIYNQDVTAELLDADIAWTRSSEDANGPRTASDALWAMNRGSAGKAIAIADADIDAVPLFPTRLAFTATATLRDGANAVTAKATIHL